MGTRAAVVAVAATAGTLLTRSPLCSPRRVVGGPCKYGGRVAAVESRVVHHAGDVHDGAQHDDLPPRFSRLGNASKRTKPNIQATIVSFTASRKG